MSIELGENVWSTGETGTAGATGKTGTAVQTKTLTFFHCKNILAHSMASKKTTKKGTSPSSDKIYQLKITLVWSKPLIWRRILVSNQIFLPDLHRIIQAAMGWQNAHLHQFMDQREYLGHPAILEDMDVLDYRKVRINSILRKPKDTLKYEYDFGDGWIHNIVLEKVVPKEQGMAYPYCMDGKGNCPPEDCGGVPGFDHFLQIMSDPKHKEHREMLEWYGRPYDPAEFDADSVNERFRYPNYGVFDFFAGN